MRSDNQSQSMSLLLALTPVVILIALLAADVIAFGEDSSYGANQIAMLFAAFVAGGIGMLRGLKWEVIRDAISKSIAQTIRGYAHLVDDRSPQWHVANGRDHPCVYPLRFAGFKP